MKRKIKVSIIESIEYTYVVESDNVEDAKSRVSDAYRQGTLPFPEDQSEIVACEWGEIEDLSPEEEGKFYEVH